MGRASGILMHISSLPEKYGIGTFGKQAYEFADFLKEAGQSYWQILPLGHTGYGDSPYQAFSAYAGNPYFIDLDLLEKEGLLEKTDFEAIDFGTNEEEVDYGKLFENRLKVLEIAYHNGKEKLKEKITVFEKENAFWLTDYAMYMAIKNKMNLVSWQEWDEDIKLRNKDALDACQIELKEEIGYWTFVQYLFFKQWHALKSYVNDLGIKIIGDIPIYVSADSSDAWANGELFKLDEHKNPTVVAGCPPDAFSESGQLWGNPIYDWEYLEKTGYKWWITRIRESLKLYDTVRIDHFRGFEAYWEIPFGDETAERGKWAKGPAMKLFDAIKAELGEIAIIAEDLGDITQEVIDFRNETGYPGMKILQFAFSVNEESTYLPHNYNKNCIVYTGTHDNDTTMGWIDTTGNREEVEFAKEYLRLDIKEGYHWGIIRGAWSSTANIAIAPMQDFLGLGNEARMNRPSTLGINWKWRMKKEVLDNKLSEKIYHLTALYKRLE
ncbi:MAG: 4-alpha-glucanotransferase [Clostridia bacterium]|jgi:4-alpha-glucanotransferase|nr:4-alpha-glucanotransferase [Clostridia bacterium]